MKNSSARILTTHIGSLVRPPDIVEMMRAKESGQPYDQIALEARRQRAVREVVPKQVEVGVDIPSSKPWRKAQRWHLSNSGNRVEQRRHDHGTYGSQL
jgi:5-methyltetrahydropteroyltriglutamate--homocysteine methyltransferase